MKNIIFLSFLFVLFSCNESDTPAYFYDRPKLSNTLVSIKPSDLWGNKVDILWVVDNSGSMQTAQTRLMQNFQFFIKEFQKFESAEWSMGLVSTSISERPYLGLENDVAGPFNYLSKNPEERFTRAVGRLGTNGSPHEVPLDAALKALKENTGFLRSEANLAIIFITDESDHSMVEASDFNQQILKMKKDHINRVEIYGGFSSNDFKTCSPGESWFYQNSKFEESVNFFTGEVFDLCSQDFGAQLAKIGNRIIGNLEYPKMLLEGPKPFLCTIKVYHNKEELKTGPLNKGGKWFYEETNNAIVFYNLSFVKSATDRIYIDYIADDGHISPDEACKKPVN